MDDSFLEVLSPCLENIDLIFDAQKLNLCQKYQDMLLEWNQKINLTSIVDPKEIAVKHFIDSLICVKYLTLDQETRMIDVGTGAGFPGIPWKICIPTLKITLLDSLAKRCQFLNEVINTLGLKEVSVVHGRAEDKAREFLFREQFTYVTARAVTSLPVLAEYCLPFVKTGGLFISLKGPEVEGEVARSEKAIHALGGTVKDIKHYRLPLLGDQRSLVFIEKTSVTPEKYPRKPGIPEKKPIL